MLCPYSSSPALPDTTTPSTAADRKPLDKLVKVWAQQGGIAHAQAWAQVNGHFNLDSVTQLPVEWIPDAVAFVEAKIDALSALAAKPEQAALPEAVPVAIAPDVTLEQIESRITALRKYISKERHEIYVDLLDQLYTVKAVRAAMGKMIIVSSIGKAIHEELTRCISSNSDTLCQYDNPCVMVRDFKALLGV